MEILIPTNDGLTIAPDFENATSYRFLNVIDGIVQKDEIRASGPVIQNPLYQQVVITRRVSPETEKNLQLIKYEVFHTGETNIINALNLYLKNNAIRESNYCCCP